jgi:hypothetical protein
MGYTKEDRAASKKEATDLSPYLSLENRELPTSDLLPTPTDSSTTVDRKWSHTLRDQTSRDWSFGSEKRQRSAD